MLLGWSFECPVESSWDTVRHLGVIEIKRPYCGGIGENRLPIEQVRTRLYYCRSQSGSSLDRNTKSAVGWLELGASREQTQGIAIYPQASGRDCVMAKTVAHS